MPNVRKRTMRSQIQRSMNLVLFITLLLSFGLLTAMVYNQTLESMQAEVEQETIYIRTAINLSEDSYLKALELEPNNSRITIVDTDGEVLYDSNEPYQEMENHKERKEIKEVLEGGVGSDVRTSYTLGKQTYYYAVRLNNGEILRVSKTMDTVWFTFLNALPFMLAIAAIVLAIAWVLGRWQTSRLIQPINELNLDNPLENDIYKELTPLLESMEVQNQEKEKVAQMRKEFSANVSHELKTPLTSISGYAEIMKSGLVRPEDMKGFSERIYNEACRLIILIEDIIKLSKLDEENIQLQKEPVELFMMTREICSRLSHQAEQKNVQVEVTGEPVLYQGVKSILDEMIYNICENAIKYNTDGGKVIIWAGNTLKGPKIIIRDTGIGIPKEDQERIFERFYRVDKSHSKETGGTGLGLSIVKHGALMHHAQISVESTLGEGTKIEILFEK